MIFFVDMIWEMGMIWYDMIRCYKWWLGYPGARMIPYTSKSWIMDLFTLALKFNLTFYTVIPVIRLEAKPVMSMVKFLWMAAMRVMPGLNHWVVGVVSIPGGFNSGGAKNQLCILVSEAIKPRLVGPSKAVFLTLGNQSWQWTIPKVVSYIHREIVDFKLHLPKDNMLPCTKVPTPIFNGRMPRNEPNWN